MEQQMPWVHGARLLTADELKQGLTCGVCADPAIGLLTHAPDRIQLWQPVPVCDVCLAQPRGWPTAKDPNLAGDARGILGHTVFAVAIDEQGENFGAFTTIPISWGKRHHGMFFDGDVSEHPRGRGPRAPHDPPMYAGVSAETLTTHWIPWDMFWRIDGRQQLARYKTEQARILGQVLTEHDGSWDRFNARPGKSIIFQLPPDLRYKGSAQLVNARKRPSNAERAKASRQGQAIVCPMLRKKLGRYFVDRPARSYRPYLECATGVDDSFVSGEQLFWDYGCDEAREEQQQGRRAHPPSSPASSPSPPPPPRLAMRRRVHIHGTSFQPQLALSVYFDIRALAEICGTTKIVLVHSGEENGLAGFSPEELTQVSCCDLGFFNTDRTTRERYRLFDNSFLCLVCMPDQHFKRMVKEFKKFARKCADRKETKLAGLGIASGCNFGLAVDLWKQRRLDGSSSPFDHLHGQAICWQTTYSDSAEKAMSRAKTNRGGKRVIAEKAFRRIEEAFNKKIDPLVSNYEKYNPNLRKQQYTTWITGQKQWYETEAKSGTVVSFDKFFYVVFWRPYNFALVARQEIKSSRHLIIAEFPAILDKTRKSGDSSSSEDDSHQNQQDGRARKSNKKQGKNEQEKPSGGNSCANMSGVGQRLAELWEREQDTKMKSYSKKETYFVPHYRQPNIPGARYAGILGANKPIPTALLAHCALGATDESKANAKIVVDEHNRFYLQTIRGRPLQKDDLVLVDYRWKAKYTAGLTDLRPDSFREELEKTPSMKDFVTAQMEGVDAWPGPARPELLASSGRITERKKPANPRTRPVPDVVSEPTPAAPPPDDEHSS